MITLFIYHLCCKLFNHYHIRYSSTSSTQVSAFCFTVNNNDFVWYWPDREVNWTPWVSAAGICADWTTRFGWTTWDWVVLRPRVKFTESSSRVSVRLDAKHTEMWVRHVLPRNTRTIKHECGVFTHPRVELISWLTSAALSSWLTVATAATLTLWNATPAHWEHLTQVIGWCHFLNLTGHFTCSNTFTYKLSHYRHITDGY